MVMAKHAQAGHTARWPAVANSEPWSFKTCSALEEGGGGGIKATADKHPAIWIKEDSANFPMGYVNVTPTPTSIARIPSSKSVFPQCSLSENLIKCRNMALSNFPKQDYFVGSGLLWGMKKAKLQNENGVKWWRWPRNLNNIWTFNSSK